MQTGNEIHRRFVELVYDKMKGRITGASVQRTLHDKPSRVFFAGTLCTRNEKATPGDIRTKVAPVKMGVEFLIKNEDLDNTRLTIIPRFSVYYKVFPTYDEQLSSFAQEHKLKSLDDAKEFIEKWSVDEEQNEIKGAKLIQVFKKFTPKPLEIQVPLADVAAVDGQIISVTQIKTMLDECLSAFESDRDKFSSKKTNKDEMRVKIPLVDLRTKEEYEEHVSKWGQKIQTPAWNCSLQVRILGRTDNTVKVSVTLENTSLDSGNDHVDNFLFDTKLEVSSPDTDIQDYVIDYLNDHYRYDGTMGAVGVNCEAILAADKRHVHSESMPSYRQMRIESKQPTSQKFADLSSDGAIAVLKELAQSMHAYLGRYESAKIAISRKSEEGKRLFEDDLRSFKEEISRFEAGILVLEKYPLALKAFRLMNDSFAKAAERITDDRKRDSWRTFQIVFIVMNLPDVVSTEYAEVTSRFEDAEVLYFPTGGGKTEAYLGLAVFTMFFDRLRGKHFGTSVITKFPLRLLSLQQIQRTADILACAELVRRQNAAEVKGERFSLGYFVGKNNTPNKLMDKGSVFGGQDIDELTPVIEEKERVLSGKVEVTSEELQSRKHLIVSKCPFCGSDKILIDADKEKIRLMHRCLNSECPLKGEDIPIYVSDIEIFRYLPTIIVSTLDKIAICGYQKNFRNIFGQVRKKCPLHGYSSTAECTEKYLCKAEKASLQEVTPKDPVPTLLVQDELHLVRESLGTYDSHYESFIEEYARELNHGRRSIKVIAATATISEYRIQTSNLYARNASRYPSQGPTISDSFYSYASEDQLNRLIIGITPHDKTIIFTMLDVIRIYHEIISGYLASPDVLREDLAVEITDEALMELLQDYRTMLSYHLAKSDGDSIANSVRGQVNRHLAENNFPAIRPLPLTGDVTFNDVRRALDMIQNPSDLDRTLLINATSMISHGVDLDALNFMVFMGMPNNTAEYIQASSRVGRKHPGIVFIVFNPTRERDQSYFKFFRKYHEYRDLLVEAVPINRWAKFSIKRTIPGIFAASVMNYFDVVHNSGKPLNMSEPFRKAYESGEISEAMISKFIKSSYKVEKDSLGIGFAGIIDDKVGLYVHSINQALGNQFLLKPMPDQPMFSLRDVDELISINMSVEGQIAMRDITAERTNDEDAVDEENEVVEV